MGNFDFAEFCLGTVNIVTNNELLLTGTIIEVRNKHNHDSPTENNEHEETITLKLTHDLQGLPVSAGAPISNPYYLAGDIVRINTDSIVTISPSHF